MALKLIFFGLASNFRFTDFVLKLMTKNHDQAEMWNQIILLLAIFQTFHTIQTFAY